MYILDSVRLVSTAYVWGKTLDRCYLQVLGVQCYNLLSVGTAKSHELMHCRNAHGFQNQNSSEALMHAAGGFIVAEYKNSIRFITRNHMYMERMTHPRVFSSHSIESHAAKGRKNQVCKQVCVKVYKKGRQLCQKKKKAAGQHITKKTRIAAASARQWPLS